MYAAVCYFFQKSGMIEPTHGSIWRWIHFLLVLCGERKKNSLDLD